MLLRHWKAGSIFCGAIMVFMVMGIVLLENVEAETYKFVFKIPSQQWFFYYPHGVAVDSSGNVYVADSGNHRIQKFKLLIFNIVDFEGDGKTDIAVYDTTGGAWWIIPSSGAPAYGVGWSGSAFKPIPGDYDWDGKTDVAIYDTTNGGWWIIPSSGVGPQGQVGAYGVGWGGSGFTPVPGDYDGDGKTDVAIYQSSNGGWWIIYSSDGSTYGMGWGGDASDVPLSTNPD